MFQFFVRFDRWMLIHRIYLVVFEFYNVLSICGSSVVSFWIFSFENLASNLNVRDYNEFECEKHSKRVPHLHLSAEI